MTPSPKKYCRPGSNFSEYRACTVSTSTILIDLHYLPSLSYFVRLLPYGKIRLEAQESYQKQSYRNRCYILTSQKVDRLTVPIRKSSSKLPYRLIEIDYSQRWETWHWRAFCTAYSRAPYFEYFVEYFRTVFLKRHTYLFDLNLTLLRTCLKLLQINKEIELSAHYETGIISNVLDARYSIHPRNRLNDNAYYYPVRYQQVFGQAFHPNLSIIDLLFCKGCKAYSILDRSRNGTGFQ